MSSEFPPETTVPTSEPWIEGVPRPEALPAVVASRGWREWTLPAVLFLATLISTSYTGLFYVYGDVGFVQMALAVVMNPVVLLGGLPFSFPLVTILLAHEMGHYLACRHYGIRCTPPFFIPLPLPLTAGTLGAFIRIRSHFQHKRALFDVGIAGPLAGFAFIVPALIIGIASSSLIHKGQIIGQMAYGEPLLFQWIGNAVLGYSPATQDMVAHPTAMAAWFGLLATSLNLLPIWQLDGGHISYAILGRQRQKRVTIVAGVALMLASLIRWPPSYLLFACLVLFLSMRFRFYHPPTLQEFEEIGTVRVILGIIALLILIVSFTPVPIYQT